MRNQSPAATLLGKVVWMLMPLSLRRNNIVSKVSILPRAAGHETGTYQTLPVVTGTLTRRATVDG